MPIHAYTNFTGLIFAVQESTVKPHKLDPSKLFRYTVVIITITPPVLYLTLTTVHEYAVHKARCREAAFKKMAAVASGYMLQTLFTAWVEDYKVTRRARRWFREQGGGKGEDSEEEKDWCWPEGDDPVSSLPKTIAVKVNLTVQTNTV